MHRIGRVVAPLAAVTAFVATTSPAIGAGHTLTTRAPVEALSADGPRVAIDVSGRFSHACNRIVVWNVLTGRVAPLTGSRGPTCGADGTSTGAGISALALAGTRAAWIVNQGGNTESDDTLITATLGGPQRVLARASRQGQVDGSQLAGTWLGGLVGDGSFLGVSAWTTVFSDPVGCRQPGGPSDPTACDPLTTRSAFRRVRSTGLSGIAPNAGVAQAADSGRVATLAPNGDVTAFTQAGRKLAQITPGATPLAVGLRGTRVVVLTKARSLEVYDALSGALVHRWPLRGAASPMVDTHDGIAIYRVYRTLYAVRLATGKTAAIATAPRRIDHLQIEGPGVTYSFSTPSRGTVRFLPFAGVSARV
jgi:hypothetical protein